MLKKVLIIRNEFGMILMLIIIDRNLPANIPLMVFAKLQTPPAPGKTFQIKRTVTPPPPAATKVDVTQEPRIISSPASVTDI